MSTQHEVEEILKEFYPHGLPPNVTDEVLGVEPALSITLVEAPAVAYPNVVPIQSGIRHKEATSLTL